MHVLSLYNMGPTDWLKVLKEAVKRVYATSRRQRFMLRGIGVSTAASPVKIA